jgi:dihydroorotate dehydrogenase electron transfer subunit
MIDMQRFLAPIRERQEIADGVFLIVIDAPRLAGEVQPGQYCQVRCSDVGASDPFLRRPLFVSEIDRERGRCSFLIYVRGRGTAWLASRPVGHVLDIIGPLGRGWRPDPTTRNLLLLGEQPYLTSMLALIQPALRQELAVTLICASDNASEPYPAALLSPEVEYQIFAGDAPGLVGQLQQYLAWADELYCGVSRETWRLLRQAYPRWQEDHLVRVVCWEPLPCVSGTCLACLRETRHGERLICREGPVFDAAEYTIDSALPTSYT